MQPRPASRLRALLGPEPQEEERPASRLRALLGAWEPDPGDPKRERRALPAGGFEYRAKAGAAPEPPQNRPQTAPPPAAIDPALAQKRAELAQIRAGGDINPGGVQPERSILPTWDRVKRSANLVRGGMTEGADFIANLPEMAARAVVSPIFDLDNMQREAAREKALKEAQEADRAMGRPQTEERLAQLADTLPRGAREMPAPEGLSLYGAPEIVDETLQSARDEREQLTGEMIDDLAVNSSPLDAALVATYGPRFTGNLADPSMLYAPLRGAAGLGKKALPVAARAAGEVAEAVERPASRLRALLEPTPPARAVPGGGGGPAQAGVLPDGIGPSRDPAPGTARPPQVAVPPPSSTGLDLRGAGQAISDNLYNSVWDRLKAGKRASPFAKNPPAEEAVEQAFRRGEVQGAEDVKRIMQETGSGRPAAPLAAPPPQVAVTERGTRIGFDYEVREASDLITSHDEALRPNPRYPPELQPRDRTRLASEAQVGRIERQLNPELLGESPHASNGAPILGPDGIVESGNARSIALKRAYRGGTEGAVGYRSWLEGNAQRFGIDPADIAARREPVLVRVRNTDVDRVSFAAEANEAPQAAMSATERAAADARRITPEMIDSLRVPESGEVNFQAHRDFVRAFTQGVNPNDLGAMFDARGMLSAEGQGRIRNAVLAKAYGDPAAIAQLIEHADSNVRNIGSALLREAPRFARIREGVAAGALHPLDITADISAALRKLSALREEGTRVPDYLAQGGLFGSELTPEARVLLATFDANARSGAKVSAILRRYADLAEGAGHPQQAGLFGPADPPSPMALLREAVTDEQGALFSMAEAPPSTLAAELAPPPPAPPAVVDRGLFAGLVEPPVREIPPQMRGQNKHTPQAAPLVLRSDREPGYFLVHPSTREPGRWQLTRFEEGVPTGHTTWNSSEDAVKSASGRFAGGEPPVGNASFRLEGGQPMPAPPKLLFGLGERPPRPPSLPGMEPPPVRPPMSTKGIENVAGLQDDLARVTDENFDEIYAARGGPVPVSQWRDAPGLQGKLGLGVDDYLKRQADRGPMSADELSLGRHYLGKMKQEAQALEARIASGQADDAARAELATRNRDVVRMMATLQGQGASENARAMRSLQEALDPLGLADTPKEKLQLAMVQHYGAKNAQEAAAIEKKAVARLRAQAARETRKAARTATAEELSAEFSALSSEFGRLANTPRTGLDPELVGLIGKLASNRIKAGVNAVEEIADQVYQVARQHLDTITLAEVKAAIVEHALAKPGKKRGPLSPEARLSRAEAGAERSVASLEARIAAGGAPSPKPPALSSPRLDALRAQQAKLREQLDALTVKKPPTDPAVQRLKAAEGAAARRVAELEKKLAAGPTLPGVKPAPLASERISALRQQAADIKSQILKDPKHSLVQRYRELLDEDTVDMISKLPDPTEDDGRALVLFLRQMEKPTFRDFRTTYWINSVLSGPKTMVRNLLGNVAKLATDTAMRPGAAVVEQGLARLQGRVPERLVRETLPATMGVFRGLPDGLKRFAFVMRNGYDPARLVSELTNGGAGAKFAEAQRLPLSPFLLSQKPWVRAVGVPVTMPGRILEATDALFKTMATTSEGYAWATRKAIQEGASDVPGRVAALLDEMPEEMVKAQVLAAQKATYQDPMSWVGLTASAIRRGPPGAAQLAADLRTKGGIGNKTLAGLVQAPETIGQHLVPFIHVSDRVAAAITDFIPGSKPFKLARLVSEQSPEASDLIARQAVGGALGLLGIAWASQGRLVGAAPKDEKLRNDFYAEGKQPYSVLIGGSWVPIRDTLGPLAGPFVAAAAYHDHVQVGEDPSAAVAGMTLSTASYMLDASYLQSLQDVIEGVDGEGGAAGRKLTSAAARTVGGYKPFSGLQSNIATARDPRVVDKEGFLDELKAGVPGLREDLPSRVGTLGEPLKLSTGAAGGFLPVVPTDSKIADPELAEAVGRLRYTVEQRRTEINRTLSSIKDARKAKDSARVVELSARLPPVSDRSQPDIALTEARRIEQEIRKLRVNDKLTPAVRAEKEVRAQVRLELSLQRALLRIQTGLSAEQRKRENEKLDRESKEALKRALARLQKGG